MKAKTIELQPTYAATIGIDWADKKHDIWTRPASGSKSEHLVLTQTPEAIHDWVAQMRIRFKNQSIAVAIETTRGALISALQAYDFVFIYPINPANMCNYRKSFKSSGAKDDRTDAMLLEEYLRLHMEKLRAWKPDTELTRKIAGFVQNRRDLVNDRTRLVNQLHSLLKTYYPLVEAVFDDMTTSMASDFVFKWPCLASLKKAKEGELTNFFFGHNCRRDKWILERLQTIKKAVALTTDPALIEPAMIKAKALAGMLSVLHKAIEEIETKTEEAMDLHPDAPIFRSFPAAGPVMAPRLLVAFGTDRGRFADSQEVQQLYGIAPVKKESGQSRVIHMRHRAPKFGKQTFHENAGHAQRKEGWTREYYKQQRDRKKGHHAAVRSLSFKLIRIYFSCWKNNQPYEQAKYEKALEKHGSPLAAILKQAA